MPSTPDNRDRTVLPPPDPPFRGEINVALADSKPDFPVPLGAPEGAPNVLVIVGDDIGYGHMGAFGGPARTPTFDRLAEQGLKYTNFHVTAVCSASRACLLTGRNSHSVGMGVIPESSTGFPGYNAMIPRSAATVFEILRQNGYGTAWIGKTHLTPLHEATVAGPFDRWPGGMGAEYFYGFFGAGVSQWHPPLWENTTPLEAPRTPEQGYHLEADMADRTIAWIERQKSIHPEKPWIAYFAPNGHKPPVGVPSEYRDGWWAGTRHGQDGLSASAGTVPFDQDVWELYDMTTDFGHATDLAAEHPHKLAELQAIFDRQARKYNVYPLADNILALLSAERPGLVSGNKASYRPGTVRIPEDAVINTKNRSFALTAELENPGGNAEGILVTVGGETGGYALVVQNAKPTFHYNWLGRERYTITSTQPLPKGPCTIRFDFAYDGGGAGKGGTGTLSVNGSKVAEGRIDKTIPVVFSTDDTFDVGADWGTPISPTYQPPFKFTGTLKQVTIEARDT